MAETYEVLKDGATVHHVEAPLTDQAGAEIGVDVVSVVHAAGDQIPGDVLPDYVKDAVASGDEHVCSLLKKVSGGKKESAPEKSEAPVEEAPVAEVPASRPVGRPKKSSGNE